MKSVHCLNNEDWLARLSTARSGSAHRFYAMYSGLTGGITTDPTLMMIPLDDHLVHRGDGVFESIKCTDGQLYNVKAHLKRLEHSCEGIGMNPPCPREELLRIIRATVRAGGQRDCLIRVLVSRGTGTMNIDPARCSGPVLYVSAYELCQRMENGRMKAVRAGISTIPLKPPQLATIKTCNYLPNVLMKLEAQQRGLDFVIALDQNGNLGEGATENIGILTPENELLMPTSRYILAGTTARRALDLAQQLVDDGVLTAAEQRDISVDRAASANEIFLFGTTTNVTPVIEWEGRPVGSGVPGPVSEKLFDRLRTDMTPQSETLTKVFE